MTTLLYIIIAHFVPVVLRRIWLLLPGSKRKAEETRMDEYISWFPISIYDYDNPDNPGRRLDRFFYRVADIPLWDENYGHSLFDLGPGVYYYEHIICFRYDFVFMKVEFWVRLK